MPRKAGILQEIESPADLTVHELLGRIEANRSRLEEKFRKKKAKEDQYYDQRYERDEAIKA